MSWLDEMFGTLFDNGTELELLGGLNFIGFTITADPANNRHNIVVAGAATVASAVTNDSGVSGASVKDALNTLNGLIATNTASIATNATAITTEASARAAADALLVPQTRTVTAGTNLSGGGALSGNITLNMSATPTGITSINGAQVAAPVQGTAITTTNSCTVAGGNNYDVTAAGGAYTITLGTTGSPLDGEIISFRTTNALANAITVTNGGTGGGNIGPSSGTMPAGVKGVYDFRWNASGTKWEYAGCKRCA